MADLRLRADRILERLQSSNPDPRTELLYHTPFQLLVAVVLSAQATDKSVNRCTESLFQDGFDAAAAVRLGPEGLLAHIRSIGLAPTKAKNVARLAELLIAEHGGAVPHSREALEALPGVGKKTASVVLAELYNEPTLAVDTHVFRVTQRLGLQGERSPEKAEQRLLAVVRAEWLPRAHHWFILHGRYVCKALKPDCAHCVLRDLCPSRNIN